MHAFDKKDIEAMDSRYRVNFINSLSGFKSLNLVGTQDAAGVQNIAPFSSVVHLGADPALVGMITRPDSKGGRHTFENLSQTGWYTLNHVGEAFVRAAHQASARYPREVSEFEATGLNVEYIEGCLAPFVAEASVKIAVQFREDHFLAINGTTLIIGEIMAVYLDRHAIDSSGWIDLEKLGTVTCSGLDAYHRTERISRLSYAKPDRPVKEIE